MKNIFKSCFFQELIEGNILFPKIGEEGKALRLVLSEKRLYLNFRINIAMQNITVQQIFFREQDQMNRGSC
jgi:hypothetical protein